METKRFNLTGDERVQVFETYKREHPDPELIVDSEFGYINKLLQAQITKVLSLLEPAEVTEAYKAGIREVVKWIRKHPHVWYVLNSPEWQAFLKKEGIE